MTSSSSSVYPSNLSGLLNIYTLESDPQGNDNSVYFEFNSDKCAEMVRACKMASKSPTLRQVPLVPIAANHHFCFGFESSSRPAIIDLIKSVNHWMGETESDKHEPFCSDILKEKKDIPLISITRNQLIEHKTEAPKKNYDKIYINESGSYIIPVHLLNKAALSPFTIKKI
jgi:hypothetical protein